jgi:asparagine synthase (glutamine-hydrolysing)
LNNAVSEKLESIRNKSDAELLSETYNILSDAVRIRLRSDVPLAVSLSGGLDSTTISALAKKHVNDLHGFTYGSEAAKRSEGPLVAKFTNNIGVKPHFIWPNFSSKELDLLLDRTLACQESPFPDLSIMAQNEVYRNVRDSGFKVLLGGQGSDEIFAGYRKFFVLASRAALSNNDLLEAARLIYSLGIMLLHESGSANVYLKSVNRFRKDLNSTFKLIDWPVLSVNLMGDSKESLTNRQMQDIQRWSIPTLLRYEDRNSMGYGVESRLPFMDYRLVELALALPVHLKISAGYGKSALRSITKGIVPDYIRLNYKKRGFDVTQSWISDGLGKSLRERIKDNISLLNPHIKNYSNFNQLLSDTSLEKNPGLLREALMLVWLVSLTRSNAIIQEIN